MYSGSVSLAFRLPSSCPWERLRACAYSYYGSRAWLVIDPVPESGNYWFCWQVTNLRNRFRQEDIRLDRPAAHCSSGWLSVAQRQADVIPSRSPRLLDRRDVFSRGRDYGQNPC